MPGAGIVEEYKKGCTTIRVHDDFFRDKTDNEVEAIIAELTMVAAFTLEAAATA